MNKWKQIALGDTATFYNGYPFNPTEWTTSGREIIRIQNLTKGSSQTNYFEGKLAKKYSVTKGDILISWSGSLGVYEWEKDDAWLNQHLFKVVFDKEEVDKSFFKYLISISLKKLENKVHGATMKHITKKNFDAFPVNLPPLPTQQKIASILDAADTLRQKDKALLAKYDELTQSLFLDMFGDPVSNPKGWEKKELGEVCILQGGFSFKSTDFVKSGVKLVKIANVHFEKLDWSDSDMLPVNFLERHPNFVLKEGDILMALTRPIIKSLGTVKAVTIQSSDLPALLNQRVARFFPDPKFLTKEFLLRIIYSEYFKNKMDKYSSTSLQPNVSNRQVESVEILLPPIYLQNQFAERVTIIEQQKAIAQASLEKSEQLFNSLLQKAFKGEL